VRVLLVSSYELGHQPVHVASPAATLRAAGHDVRALDVSVEPFDWALVDWAERVAFSVPMHTAMRMAVVLATSVRDRRPGLPVCLYGLYAGIRSDATAALDEAVAERVIAGEYEPALLAWAGGAGGIDGNGGDTGDAGLAGDAVGAGSGHRAVVHLGRSTFVTPARDLLPPLESYARLILGDEERLVGAVEASHGCSHRCRHCPLPVVYDGRLRIVPEDVVVGDVAQLVAMGARHITFADPDFLNGPRHAMRVARGVHAAFPEITFDCTVKVEHILAQRELWSELAAAGCLFVVSAFESVDDTTLHTLDKGHTAADASAAVSLLRRHGIEIRPSWLPFTPWATAAEIVAMLDFVVAHDLVANVDAVQYTIRLLLPEGSLLLSAPQVAARLQHYDTARLSWLWTAEEEGLDELQLELAALVEAAAADGVAALAEDSFAAVDARVRAYSPSRGPRSAPAGPRRASRSAGPAGPRPRLSEPWFCCSEPTLTQQEAAGVSPARR
jgi:hypothetical protein